MRLFTGIDLREDVRERLERLLTHLRPCAHLKWSPVYNLHVTLKFIGEWPEEKLPQLETALRSVDQREPIAADVKGLGWFPNPHHPRVFWVGVQGGVRLEGLAKDIDAALVPLGIATEERPYNAHLTLARIKEPCRRRHCGMRSRNWSRWTTGRFRWIDSICIAASRGRPDPSIPSFRSIHSRPR